MKNDYQELLDRINQIESKLGYVFKDKSLLAMSFVHRSYLNEHRDTVQRHNERLEFLGDSILGMLIAEYLYCLMPDLSEGDLSRLRSRLVESNSCFLYAQQIDLAADLLLGKGEKMNDGRGRESIIADLFEALIAAIYLDGGLQIAKDFLFIHCGNVIESIIEEPQKNWKAELQDLVQKKYQQTPIYRVVDEEGPDHSKVFMITVLVNDKEVGQGRGLSKKEAQQAAACDAIKHLS